MHVGDPPLCCQQNAVLVNSCMSASHHCSNGLARFACRLQVRFFERVKLERRISKLERQPAPEEAEAKRAAQLAALRDDLLVRLSWTGPSQGLLCLIDRSAPPRFPQLRPVAAEKCVGQEVWRVKTTSGR